MQTTPRTRKPGRALAALTVSLGLSGLAQAQQNGLFPLQPIRRERVPCPLEDPVYKLYRSQYYGYYPTQWRRFPDGWNLPSPEGPSSEPYNLKDHPIEAPKPSPLGEEEEGPGPAPGGMQRQPIPRPPAEERSPFEMDTPNEGGGAAPRGAAPGRRAPATAPRPTTPPAQDEPSPFDMNEPAPPPGAGGAPAPAPRPLAPGRPAAPARRPDGGTPDLNPPGGAASHASPRAPRDEAAAPDDGADRGPLLAMPDMSLPPVAEPGEDDAPRTADPATRTASDAAPEAAPAAPRRGGRIGALFSGLGLNWRRR